jgi:Tol biopolymer transport system component
MTTASASGAGLKGLLRRPAVLLALAFLVLASAISLLGRFARGRAVTLERAPLTGQPGIETFPAFSPDGQLIAYSGRGPAKDDSFRIFVRGAGEPRQLTRADADDIGPAWSPDGSHLAFARVQEQRATYIVVRAAGGAERQLAEFDASTEAEPVPGAAWTREGKSLVVSGAKGAQPPGIFLVSMESGAVQALTTPPEGSDGDVMPAVSPDGKSLAFVRRVNSRDASDIWICDLAGGSLRRVTFDERPIRGVAWTPEGRDLVYASARAGGWKLWRVAAFGGSPRQFVIAGRQAQYPAIAPIGHRLAYSDSRTVSAIWRAELANPAAGRAIVRTTGRHSAPAYSPDGRKIAFLSDEGSGLELRVADAEGGNRARLVTSERMGRPRWSPDSKNLVFEMPAEGRSGIYTIAAAGGQPQRVTRMAAGNPSWSRDGKWIYFGARQIWKVPPAGGEPLQITKRGGSDPVESADGKWVYYHRGRAIWRVPSGGGEEEQFYHSENNLLWSLVAAKQGLYFLEFDFRRRRAGVSLYDFPNHRAKQVLVMEGADLDRGRSFDVSPDGKCVVYPRVDQEETNLMVVEGFR